jgi:hypothetical protein
MQDDWRLRADLHEDGPARALTERLGATELEHGLETAFHDRVIVSRDGAEVFCYAADRKQAEQAEQAIHSLAATHGWRVDFELKRWHPTAADWEDPDKPLPETDADVAAERAERIAAERRESDARGFPTYEVRVHCATRRDAAELAERLRAEGLPSVRRWRFLLFGAPDEDSAAALAERLRAELPPQSTVAVQASVDEILSARPRNPFAVLGGLGG